MPYVLAITAGTTVDFPNNDRTYHNVFSFSKAKRFDLGPLRQRALQVGALRPARASCGVFCDIHSHMSAFILVFAHRFFAVTDAEGRYRIDGRAAGHLHPRGLERRPGPRVAHGHRAGRRGVEADFVVK